MSHASTAAKVRADKEKRPELYCPSCLWRTGGGYCPRHGRKPVMSAGAAVAIPLPPVLEVKAK